MRIASRTLGALAAAAAIACTHSSAIDHAATVRAAIDSLHAQTSEWYAAGLGDSLASLYASNGQIFVPNAAPIAGRDSISAYWRRMFDEFRWDVRLETQSVMAHGPVAVEHGRYRITMTAKGSASPYATDQGHYVAAWQHSPDGWRIRYDMALSESTRAHDR